MDYQTKSMFARVAQNYGDLALARQLESDKSRKMSFADNVELLAQSSRYIGILPEALGTYIENGESVANAIIRFGDFHHRSIAARKLAEIIEKSKKYAVKAASNLEDPRVIEQLSTAEEKDANRLKEVIILNGCYGEYDTIDRLLEDAPDNISGFSWLADAFQKAIENYDSDTYKEMVEEIFALHEELGTAKNNISILYPGLEANDIELVKALRSFANTYQKAIAKRERWAISMPTFSASMVRYNRVEGGLLAIIKRVESLLGTGRVRLVEDIVKRINDETFYRSDKDIEENPAEVLDAVEKMNKANLPDEIYFALGTEFGNTYVVEFAKRVLDPHVLSRIRQIDKMGPHLGKAAIGYTALEGSLEDVQYVADNILKVSYLGKTKQIIKAVMHAARYDGKGAECLRGFFPEGIDKKSLSKKPVKKVIRYFGFHCEEHRELMHEILRENLGAFEKLDEKKLRDIPNIYRWDKADEIRDKFEEWLGIKVPAKENNET